MEGVYSIAYEIEEKLKPCVNFRFFKGQKAKEIMGTGKNIRDFWYQLNMLLILCLRSSVNTIIKLINSLAWCFDSRNEIFFAMLLRSFIEHACTLEDIAVSIELRIDYLTDKVWPSNLDEIIPIEDDLKLREDLLRFVLSRKIELKEDFPSLSDSKNRWRKYLKSLRSLPEEIKAKNIMKLIDSTSRRKNILILRTGYEVLSEYVHSNSASRIFQFHQDHSGQSYSLFEPPEKFTDGFRKTVIWGGFIIPYMSALTKDSLSTIDKSMMPMGPLLGSKAQKPGHMKIYDNYGRKMWVPNRNVTSYPARYDSLTKNQIDRLKKVYNVFSDVDKTSFKRWVDNFTKEPDFVREIETWEHMAKVFHQEIKERVNIDMRMKEQLYEVIILSLDHDTHKIIIRKPALAMLPFFERVVKRVRKRNPT